MVGTYGRECARTLVVTPSARSFPAWIDQTTEPAQAAISRHVRAELRRDMALTARPLFAEIERGNDAAWMERLWYTGHPAPEGDVIFDLGIGYHPNRNVMDGFAGVTIGTTQYNLRLSRRLRPDPLRTRIGPQEVAVLEGVRRHRPTLDENESGLRVDLEYQATLNPHEEEPHYRRRHGRVTENLMRAQQFGRDSGWLEVDGQRVEIKPQR